MAKDVRLTHFTPPQMSPETSLSQYFPSGARQAAPAAAPPPQPSAAIAAVEGALGRLEDTIDEETEALETHRQADLADINRRKSQSLLELTRLARQLPGDSALRLRSRVEVLRDKLTHNHGLVGLHLRAVREISDLMVGVLSEAESDGTYGASRARREAI